MGRSSRGPRTGARWGGLALAPALTLLGSLFVAVPPSGAAGVQITAVRQIGGSGHADLYGWGMATLRDGSVLVGDYWNYRIVHYAKDGTFLGTVVPRGGSHLAPYGIAVDPTNDDLYFGDVDSNATVDKYSAAGNFLLQFGGIGGGANRFVYPSRVAVATDRTVYVADARGNTVSAHGPTGTELFSVSSAQTPNPRGIGIDGAGRVYVSDSQLRRVQVFDRNLKFVTSFGAGMLGGDLRGLAVDKANGWVYAVDAATGKVYKFTTGGQFLLSFGSEGTGNGQFSGGGRDVTVDGDGNVWVGDMPNFRAQKFTPTGQFMLAVPDPAVPPAEGGFTEPRAVGVDGSNNVFVADSHNWRIEKFDPSGQFSLQWGSRGGGAYKFNYPKGLAVDRVSGSVYVCDTDNGRVKKYTNGGVFVWESIGMKCNGADVAGDGSVYIADSQGGRVVRLNAANGAQTVIASTGSGNGQFLYPNGVAVDPDGTIWVTDTTRDTVQHLSATGAYIGKVGSPGSGASGLQQGWDVEVFDNYVFVSDAAANTIKVWTKQGTFVTAYGGGGTALGRFQAPKGMDMTLDGHLYVVEHSGERVQELRVVAT
jgi:DNA-binding beta-propeller fold protein YncE